MLLSEFCEGFDLFGKYADGNGGEYTALIIANSTQCGFYDDDRGFGDGTGGGFGGGTGGGGGGRGPITEVDKIEEDIPRENIQ